MQYTQSYSNIQSYYIDTADFPSAKEGAVNANSSLGVKWLSLSSNNSSSATDIKYNLLHYTLFLINSKIMLVKSPCVQEC